MRARVTQHEDRVRGDLERGVVHASLHVSVVLEDDRGPGVVEQVGRGGEMLDDGAAGRKVAVQDGETGFGRKRVLPAPDHPLVEVGDVELGSRRGSCRWT